MPEKTSKWFPYYNVHESYYDSSATVELPKKICDYLLDAPQYGYTPIDDNSYPRCRFWKYLYYDGAKPLENALPTVTEKMAVLFDPNRAEEPPTDKGYRLIPQIWIKPSQTDAQTRVYVYCGREVPNDNFKIAISVHFVIWTHYTSDLNMKTDEYNRALAIESAIIEAFHGLNMSGVGVFGYDKRTHPDCGARPLYDGDINVGRELVLGLELATTALQSTGKTDNMPNFNKQGNIKLW